MLLGAGRRSFPILPSAVLAFGVMWEFFPAAHSVCMVAERPQRLLWRQLEDLRVNFLRI